ncbi:MAG TPA: hypothetical protein VN841_23030 [Bryobacteraceae bacterium]|nr:hypothetical protein [Bryobacteraceae bacterium]
MTLVAINPRWRLAAPCLCAILAWAPTARAQQPAAPAAQLPTTESLKLLILAGQKEANDLQRRVMAPLVVQVLDQSDNPVEGADVVFRFPASGPGASFDGLKASQTFRTNAEGQARATNWTANNQVGSFQVRVTASLGNQFGQAIVSMSNVTRVTSDTGRAHRRWMSKKVVIIVAVVAAGAVAGILISRNGGSSGPTTVTISPGTPTLGGAH